VQTILLIDAEFDATCVKPMQNITGGESEVVDIWPYFDAIPPSDLQPFSMNESNVQFVYRSGDNRFDHVLIPTSTKNVYLVIVVDLNKCAVFGHHVLNLNEKYGIESPPGPN
jgi:hypothetical protein